MVDVSHLSSRAWVIDLLVYALRDIAFS
jgi:hypothetical protein